MSTNNNLTQNGNNDKLVISNEELERVIGIVCQINEKVLEYQSVYDELGQELKLVESHLKTYLSWRDLTLKEVGRNGHSSY